MDRRGRDRIVFGFTTTCVYHHQICEFEPRSLRVFGGFLWVLRFPPSTKLTTTI
jgi:hypothetical protein